MRLIDTNQDDCLYNVIRIFFFFNEPTPTEIYTYCHTLSLLDALPICVLGTGVGGFESRFLPRAVSGAERAVSCMPCAARRRNRPCARASGRSSTSGR